MRFGLAAVFLATIVGTGLTAPLASQRRSLVGDVGNLLGGITQGVVVDVVVLETQLVSLLGPIVQTIESALPTATTLASKLVSLVDGVGAQATDALGLNNVVQIVGEAIAMVAQGVDLNAVNAYLNAATGGTITSLEAALGINNLTQVLGL
ncbi:uncharacterized protein TrAFT101_010623 [Trichoderma asperellum]|uniref:Uncharacterized protein n=1 Tax=Trichoderma asperellum (strain ATCC 204424 / CBS 433.97 / NBRC 101777) TaxID=1042311 RepID=A0A2T3YTB6_TRIA4|nr:hypothetical protein M441DRAFT_62515 [Trichoderma asperellum CBS 433.97]PTB35777.1 hypothetical protein M441DRAFT_62515 [Trichoderma asperellum CBS 433.97]UKZ95810.1 hypothetical protein TrAFT101_010623 [Trichoderma asperellum]